MISRIVDSLTANHPNIAGYFRDRITCFFDTTASRNFAAFLCTGIAAGLFAGGDNVVIKFASLAITAIVWLQTSVLAGFAKHWSYPVLTAMYLMLPYVFVIRPDTAEAAQATEFQYMLSDLMLAVPLRPMRMIAGEGDAQTVSLIIYGACTVLFLVGVRLRNTAKRSDFYCRTRLEQLQ